MAENLGYLLRIMLKDPYSGALIPPIIGSHTDFDGTRDSIFLSRKKKKVPKMKIEKLNVPNELLKNINTKGSFEYPWNGSVPLGKSVEYDDIEDVLNFGANDFADAQLYSEVDRDTYINRSSLPKEMCARLEHGFRVFNALYRAARLMNEYSEKADPNKNRDFVAMPEDYNRAAGKPVSTLFGDKLYSDAEYTDDYYGDDHPAVYHLKLNGSIIDTPNEKHVGFSNLGLADPLYSIESTLRDDEGYEDMPYDQKQSNIDVVSRNLDYIPDWLRDKYSKYFSSLGKKNKFTKNDQHNFNEYNLKLAEELGGENSYFTYETAPGYKFDENPWETLHQNIKNMMSDTDSALRSKDANLYVVETPLADVIKASEMASKYTRQRDFPQEIVTKSIRPVLEIPHKELAQILKKKNWNEEDMKNLIGSNYTKDLLSDEHKKTIMKDLSNWYNNSSRQFAITKGIRYGY